MFVTCFYAPVIPIGLVYAVVGLSLFYWA